MDSAQRPKLTKLKPFCLITHALACHLCTVLVQAEKCYKFKDSLDHLGLHSKTLSKTKQPQKQKGTNSIWL